MFIYILGGGIMKKDILAITGMTCAVCASTVAKAVGKVPGVTKAEVNFATEKLHVEYSDELELDTIKAAVVEAGYDVAQESSGVREVTIPIGGMTCASCVAAVDRALTGLEGVSEAS